MGNETLSSMLITDAIGENIANETENSSMEEDVTGSDVSGDQEEKINFSTSLDDDDLMTCLNNVLEKVELLEKLAAYRLKKKFSYSYE